MITYEKYTSTIGIEFIKGTDENGKEIHFAIDPSNADYQEYLKSLDEASTL